MKNILKKLMSVTLAVTILSVGNSKSQVSANTDWNEVFKNTFSHSISSLFTNAVPKFLFNMWNSIKLYYDEVITKQKVEKFKGFREPQEIIKKLKDIQNNQSEIKIYGQNKAKKQLFEALSGVTVRIDNTKRTKTDVKDTYGNIVYLIGPSGVGKTKMCYAIADAFLKHPEKTCIFCHSESITNESELGTQLFKTVTTKDIGKKRLKNLFFGHDGLVPKDEESPILKHILNWYESVVILDEYEKMKQKSAKHGTVMNIQGINIPIPTANTVGAQIDNSADEILRSIASTSKYSFMNKEIDCSKVLFLITTNETREELENNFGINGIQGGAVQRLNIVEFEHLPLEACRGIVNDLIEKVNSVLVDKDGPFKLNSVEFDVKSIELMAKYIFQDKIMQGRARYKLENKILGLFSKNIGEETDMDFIISFVPKNEQNEETFIKKKIKY